MMDNISNITSFSEDEQRDWKNIKETYHNGIEKFYKISFNICV
jgi:hypothetical protein